MIVLDTNVLSELMKARPERSVVNWIGEHKTADLFITALTQGEILYGLEILPSGKRRTALKESARAMFKQDFARRILPFDTNAVKLFAIIVANRKKTGFPISQIDAQIAAIAVLHNATLATRNIKDFKKCGIDIINPWE